MERTMAYRADDQLSPVHPGEILEDELAALDMSARKFAAHIGVPPNTVTEIMNGDRRVTAEMALRLGAAFGTGELESVTGSISRRTTMPSSPERNCATELEIFGRWLPPDRSSSSPAAAIADVRQRVLCA